MKGNHLTEIYTFFNEISKFQIIYTDRLHVAIAGSLMDREVHLYPASYFKSRAIYMSSINNFFEKTHFYENFSLEKGQL
jgi:exopolysaccharide biosynthesis predicted pyruvyltransferase EpsI